MPRRLERLANPKLFLKGYYPNSFFRPFSRDQEEAIEVIIDCAKYGADEILCAPRGDWKTETVKHMIIYLICAELVRFTLLFGATSKSAGLNFDHIKKQLESELFAADFPEIADPIIELQGASQKAAKQTFMGNRTEMIWSADNISLPKINKVPGTDKPSPFGGVKLTYRGLESHIRGVNILGDRPDFAFGDDLETRESANSDDQIATREDILDNDIGGLAGGGDSLPTIVLGTIQNRKCLTNKKLKQWGGKRYQAVLEWPTNPEGIQFWIDYVETRREEREAGSKDMPKSHQIYVDNRDVMDEGSKLGNPHNYSRKTRKDGTPVELSGLQRVYNRVADKGWKHVLCELQNDPPEDNSAKTLGLTYQKVLNRVSGLKHRELSPKTEIVTATIDLGMNECHWSIVGWQPGMSGQFVNYGVTEVHGSGSRDDVEQNDLAIKRALHQFRMEILQGEICERIPDNILIDSGNHRDVVYGFVKEVDDGTGLFKAAKGLAPYGHYRESDDRRVGNHWHANKQAEHGVWLYNLDSNELKRMVHHMWLTPTFDEAKQFSQMAFSVYSAFRANGDPHPRRHLSFAKHQVAEEWRTEFKAGKKGEHSYWHKVNTNNHWFDCSYMHIAAALMLGIWVPLDEKPPEQVQAIPPRAPAPTGSSRFTSPAGHSFIARR